jgi:hypothetical protein
MEAAVEYTDKDGKKYKYSLKIEEAMVLLKKWSEENKDLKNLKIKPLPSSFSSSISRLLDKIF